MQPHLTTWMLVFHLQDGSLQCRNAYFQHLVRSGTACNVLHVCEFSVRTPVANFQRGGGGDSIFFEL